MRMGAIILGLLATAAAPDESFQGRVEAIEKGKITLRAYQAGDSIEKPSGRNFELVIDAETRVLNIQAKEIIDEELRRKILSVGQVLVVKYAQKKEKDTALVLQLLGG